ncbi:hypothetical protein [Methanobacterium bryantii]|uniref:hypothetical protein n=1 Tax=Methanobacterium bryantii TaxID=2161 RepID=UPI0015CD0DD8|nr:hypothetical protein [Methanobacterium bryantii]
MNKAFPKFEKFILNYINEMGKTSGGFISIVNSDTIEDGNPKIIGQTAESIRYSGG